MNVQARVNRHKGESDMSSNEATITESAPAKEKSSNKASKATSTKSSKSKKTVSEDSSAEPLPRRWALRSTRPRANQASAPTGGE
jgi:hypothetical protein